MPEKDALLPIYGLHQLFSNNPEFLTGHEECQLTDLCDSYGNLPSCDKLCDIEGHNI